MANEYTEFTKSHTNGWGRIPLLKSKEPRIFKVLICGENKDITIEFITARKATKVVTYPYQYVLDNAEWIYPESKYVNTPNYVVRSVAMPLRQYSKVLTAENCYFSEPFDARLPESVRSKLKQSALDVLSGYLDAYPPYYACIDALNRGDAFARAFSKRFLVTMYPGVPNPLLVYKGAFIGYDANDRIICAKASENLNDVIVSATGKAVYYQEEAA